MLVMIVGRCVSATNSGIAGGSEATGNLGGDQSVAQTGGVLTAKICGTGDNKDSDSSEWSSTDVSENEDQDAGEY